MTETVKVIQFEVGEMANYTYIILDTASGEGMIVDPPDDTSVLLASVKEHNLKITGLLLTHGHYDHVGGLDPLCSTFNVPVYLSEHEAPFYTPACRSLKKTSDNEKIPLGQTFITCLHTPGHAPGCQCFLIKKNLLTGDTLFIDAVGRADLPGGNASLLWQSLQRIKTLPDDTVIWPGHNYGAVSHELLGRLKTTNPFLTDDENLLRDFLG